VHEKAIACGVSAAAAVAAFAADMAIVSGVGIGVRAAWVGGTRGVLALADVFAGRIITETFNARFVYGSRASWMPGTTAIGLAGRAAGNNIAQVGLGAAASLFGSEPPSVGGFLKGFLPGASISAIRQAVSACRE
jgi:hypothetical protein